MQETTQPVESDVRTEAERQTDDLYEVASVVARTIAAIGKEPVTIANIALLYARIPSDVMCANPTILRLKKKITKETGALVHFFRVQDDLQNKGIMVDTISRIKHLEDSGEITGPMAAELRKQLQQKLDAAAKK